MNALCQEPQCVKWEVPFVAFLSSKNPWWNIMSRQNKDRTRHAKAFARKWKWNDNNKTVSLWNNTIIPRWDTSVGTDSSEHLPHILYHSKNWKMETLRFYNPYVASACLSFRLSCPNKVEPQPRFLLQSTDYPTIYFPSLGHALGLITLKLPDDESVLMYINNNIQYLPLPVALMSLQPAVIQLQDIHLHNFHYPLFLLEEPIWKRG